MKKLAYYALGVYLAVVPFAFVVLAMIYLSYSPLDNYELAAVGIVLHSIYFIYLVWMFED